jgi:hypothetical protein
VWGTTATSDELTRNFGTALEDTSIGDCRLVALFAEKSLQAIFGVLQHYPPMSRHRQIERVRPKVPTTDIRLSTSPQIWIGWLERSFSSRDPIGARPEHCRGSLADYTPSVISD